ncbi:hypothetical protein [Evansella halocellulosilytica]|uniref:hypothetical protein n=1 Tax=Evansella halocellulosilytica TaxID=2011013 RepID=UPI000BB8B76E|nr:hypothetical protein [Evansella halocellulosilytica]
MRKTQEDISSNLGKQESEYEIEDENSIDVLNLPSRKEIHQQPKENERKRYRRKKKKQQSFPLVRILVILFFILVTLVITYPLWIDKII